MFSKLIKGTIITTLTMGLFTFQMNTAEATSKVMWGKTELRIGQIGKVTILERTQLVKPTTDGKYESVRILYPGDEFRVYQYKGQNGGLYGVGGGSFIQKSTRVKYESPSKKKLAILESYKNIATPGKTYPDGWKAPVLKSKYKNDDDYTRNVFEKELGMDEGRSYHIKSSHNAIVVGISEKDYDAIVMHKLWDTGDSNFKESYRIPIVSKEIFKYYFADEANRIFDYYQKGQFPDNSIVVNERTVKFSYSKSDGWLIMNIGFRNKSN